MKSLALLFLATTLPAQVQPAPGWCSMAHCNNQMSDFVPRTPPGLTSGVYVKSRDTVRYGVGPGLGCVSNGANVACSYKESPDALVYYDATGNVLWTSGALLDSSTYSSAPIIQADGSVVIGDDQHIFKFNSDGSIAWSTPSAGGSPVSLITTPNGAIVAVTHLVGVNSCPQNNCILQVQVDNAGKNYTTASVTFTGGDCVGAIASPTISSGQITAITVTTQPSTCLVPPDVIIQGDGSGAVANTQLGTPTPVAVYDGVTGALVGSTFLYAGGTSGPYYQTINTPCVNNGSFPNRIYVSTNVLTSSNLGALWAVDIDPTNLVSPINPAWNIVIGGPSGASPLCIGNNVYFDGSGIVPGDSAGTTIFGVQDTGTAGVVLFNIGLGTSAGHVTCNFAMDPTPTGGFWHQLKNDPNIYHRDGVTGNLISTVNMTSLLTAMGAPPGTYWARGVFTTYGTPDHPYLVVSESAINIASYLVLFDMVQQTIVWALPLYPGNSPLATDTPEGAAALVMDPSGQPVLVTAAANTGAYFVAGGQGTLALSAASLSFGNVAAGNSGAPQIITVTNSASSVLNISGVAAAGDFVQTNTCTAPLAPGTSCAITVTFAPSVIGTGIGSITITDNAAGSPHSVALAGVGITGLPSIGLSAGSLTFASQIVGTTSPPQIVTLTNTGTAPLAFTGIVAGGDAMQANTCPASLAPGASCLVQIMFAAGGLGQRTGTITITGNFPNSPQVLALAGIGILAQGVALGLSSTSLVFPSQAIGSGGTPQNVTLANAGITALSLSSIAASGDASQTNNCGQVVAPGGSCVITIAFAAAAIGLRTGSVVISSSAPDSPASILVTGVGLGNPVPLLNQPILPAGQLQGGASFTLTVTGAQFMPGAVVTWCGTPLPTTFISSTLVSAIIPASALANPGTAWVNVSNPGPGGGLSNPAWVPVTTPSVALQLGRTDLPASPGPQAVIAADLNGDGKPDLVVANSAANTVSIFMSNGDGTFATRVDYPTGRNPVAIAVGDLNGDGRQDIVAVNQADNSVSILAGNGDGTFVPLSAFATGSSPSSVAVGDFDRDGKLDLAVTNMADNTISILEGDGNGIFETHVDYPAGPSPTAILAGDFNGDGSLDLALANDYLGGSVSVLVGNGDGTWRPPVAYPTGDSLALVAADFNNDGKLDLASVNRMKQSLSVLLGNGDATFQTALVTPLEPGPAGLAVGGWAGDGTLQVIVPKSSGSTVSLLWSNGDGTFQSPTDYIVTPGPVAIVTADFNGDGRLDMAVASPVSNTISILMQQPAITLSNTSLSFGNVALGGSASQSLTLTNSGSAPLTISSITTAGAFSQTSNCLAPLASGSQCTITVTYTPGALAADNALLTINGNLPGAPPTVSLQGTGTSISVIVGLALTKVTGGNTVLSNTLLLSSPAPAGGAVVTISSSSPAIVSVPASVTIAAGSTMSPGFNIVTAPVATNTTLTLTATYNGVTGTATLTVQPATLSQLQLSAASVFGGQSVAGNLIVLNGQAPPGGATILITSSNTSVATVPALVSIAPYTTTSPAFTINTASLKTATTVTISAVYGLTTLKASLMVNPVGVASITLSPKAVIGGTQPAAANIVTLTGPAPAGGAVVTLSSGNLPIVSPPATVTVPAGAVTSLAFPIGTTPLTTSTLVTISASYNGTKKSLRLTVNPPGLQSVRLGAAKVKGRRSISSNTITLNGPAPAGGVTVSVSSSQPAVATVPAAVIIPAGATSQTFTITTTPVTSSTSVTISVTYLAATKSATLSVSP